VAGWCSLTAVFGLALAGCGRLRLDRPETYPVRGRLLVADKPAAGAWVQLNPTSDPGLFGLCPHGIVDVDGSFELTTYNTGDGAPAGSYGLTVKWPSRSRPNREEGPDRLRGRYSDPRRPLKQVQVSAGDNDLGTIRLP
jgi:hypothetical protein